VQQLLQLLGHSSFAITAVPNASFYTRHLQALVIPTQVKGLSLATLVQLTTPARQNLRFWAALQQSQARQTREFFNINIIL